MQKSTDISEHFEDLYMTYYDAILRYVSSRIDSKQTAHDVTAEVFLKVWKTLSQWKQIEFEKARIYSIARTTIIDEYKRKKSSSLTPEIINSTPADSDLKRIESSLISDRILESLQTLWEDIAEIVELKVRFQLTYKEISLINWKSEDANKKAFSRARRHIRWQLWKKLLDQDYN